MNDTIFDAFPEIETDSLILREIMPEDSEAIYAIFSDAEVTRYYDLVTMKRREEADELIDFFDQRFETESMIRWGITRKSDDVVIGTCGYVLLHRHRGEIGYDLLRSEWRKGIMTEAIDAIVDFGFSGMGLQRIEALVMPENVASAKLLRKLGFAEEGTLRDYDHFKGAFHDMRCFSLLKQEYYES
ncbi:MAG: GNAT family protein [Caldilineaceae bacterium]